jgi:hypothetical protein
MDQRLKDRNYRKERAQTQRHRHTDRKTDKKTDKKTNTQTLSRQHSTRACRVYLSTRESISQSDQSLPSLSTYPRENKLAYKCTSPPARAADNGKTDRQQQDSQTDRQSDRQIAYRLQPTRQNTGMPDSQNASQQDRIPDSKPTRLPSRQITSQRYRIYLPTTRNLPASNKQKIKHSKDMSQSTFNVSTLGPSISSEPPSIPPTQSCVYGPGRMN